MPPSPATPVTWSWPTTVPASVTLRIDPSPQQLTSSSEPSKARPVWLTALVYFLAPAAVGFVLAHAEPGRW